MHARAHKMSKSRGNVVNPDDVVKDFGGDSLRLYEMFMGPLRDTKVCVRSIGFEGVYNTANSCTTGAESSDAYRGSAQANLQSGLKHRLQASPLRGVRIATVCILV